MIVKPVLRTLTLGLSILASFKVLSMNIQSDAFQNNGNIAIKYTCDGANISPPLTISDIPTKTQSLVLIVDDPDAPDPAAPKMTWVHWVIYNLPITTQNLTENSTATNLPNGSIQGINDFKITDYKGPCPPIGKHRYFFKLYAVDKVLPNFNQQATKQKIMKAINSHVLEQAVLIGLYQKKN